MARPVILCYFIYASNEPKSVLARDLGDCRDNLRNSRSMFLIVLQQDNDTMDGNRAEYFFHILFCYRLFYRKRALCMVRSGKGENLRFEN